MLEFLPGIRPEVFFEASCDLFYAGGLPLSKKHLLPDSSSLLLEDSFVKVYAGWNEKELLFHFDYNSIFTESFFPDFRKGDSIELFIDTRALMSQVVTKFCHHFVFLPKRVGEIQAKEVTRFRVNDLREPFDLENVVKSTDSSVSIILPKDVFLGYEPTLGKIGFNYRINRKNMPSKHLFFSSKSCNIEKHPNTWGILNLVKK